MRTVDYTCPFVPAEWIAAHGVRPRRLQPRSAGSRPGAHWRTGLCPYAGAFMQELVESPTADGVVVTTLCDQMRRAAEVIQRDRPDRPVFLLNVPRIWQTPAGQGLYRDELLRLGRFLVRLGGQAPSDSRLCEVMLAGQARREAALAGGGDGESGAGRGDRPESTAAGTPVRLALVGGPLMREDRELLEMIRSAGGAVVLDATESGELTLPAPFDAERTRLDPLGELVQAYLGSIPHPSRRPSDALYEWLDRQFAARGVRGVVFHRYVWCDTWHGEAARLKEWCRLPVLDLDRGDDHGAAGRCLGRIQSFLETLR